MIRLIDVSKEYDDFEAVKNISLEVEKGEILVLLGPSGCGKSTTLRLINRMVERTGGRIEIKGKDIDSIPQEQLRRGMGYVIQNIGLFPHMNVARNIATVPSLLGWDKVRIEKRSREMLELVGLDYDRYIGKLPRELSGGEAQRIGVARALASDPDILLMDEPFGAVDPINRLRLQKEFSIIQKKLHKTVIFVTHDVEEAMLLGDRICIMREGEIVQTDTPEKIVLRPQDDFVRSFFGGEGALKLLSRYLVKDFVEDIPVEGEPLEEDATLKDALSLIILRGDDRVAAPGGSISLGRIMSSIRMVEHEKD
ncbi:MAG TPA: ABC transporter ATP-binding protein [Clostridiaceae bacterium]|nr:ABC transporter ATP-binding protein [Clostridiaceae bacterium]